MINKTNIDVSKCMHHDGNYCPIYDTHCNLPDCYYKKAEYYRQALKDIEEIINTPPDDTRIGKIILRLAEVEY